MNKKNQKLFKRILVAEFVDIFGAFFFWFKKINTMGIPTVAQG